MPKKDLLRLHHDAAPSTLKYSRHLARTLNALSTVLIATAVALHAGRMEQGASSMLKARLGIFLAVGSQASWCKQALLTAFSNAAHCAFP